MRYRLFKHKITRYPKNFGDHGPFAPPGYAYVPKVGNKGNFNLKQATVCSAYPQTHQNGGVRGEQEKTLSSDTFYHLR